jgi:hypothetical protein
MGKLALTDPADQGRIGETHSSGHARRAIDFICRAAVVLALLMA